MTKDGKNYNYLISYGNAKIQGSGLKEMLNLLVSGRGDLSEI